MPDPALRHDRYQDRTLSRSLPRLLIPLGGYRPLDRGGDRQMKALVLEDFGRMVVEELPDPDAGPGEVLVSVVATGICGSDLPGYTGENGRRVPGQVMGHEPVGTVAALGAGTERAGLAVGDTVTFNPVVVPESAVEEYAGREQMGPDKHVIGVAPHIVPSFAQLVAVPLRNVGPLPSEMPVEYGAL